MIPGVISISMGTAKRRNHRSEVFHLKLSLGPNAQLDQPLIPTRQIHTVRDMFGNARFPHGPSALAFALSACGSILVTTGPALRDLAVQRFLRWLILRGTRLRLGTEWFVAK